MKIVFVLLNLGVISLIIYYLARHWQTLGSKLFWVALLFHLSAGLSVGLVYKFYYSANDTWEFFNNATKVANLAKEDILSYLKLLVDFSWDQRPYIATHDFRSMIFIKMISGLCLITNNNYWIIAAYFAMIAFCGAWFLWRKIGLYFENSRVSAAVAFLFFPSVVFWSSGIEKETLALASLYFLAGIFLQFFYDRRSDKVTLILAILSCAMLWTLKYYWAGVFCISVISALTVQWLSLKWQPVKKSLSISFFLFFILMGVAVSFLHPNFYLDRFLNVLVENHDAFMLLSREDNSIHYFELSASVKSVMINSPWALISGIFRPFVGEGQGMLGRLASFEELVILILFLTSLGQLKDKLKQSASIPLLTTVAYCTMLCIFLALSTPNLGTLSRYRVGFLPFFVFSITYGNPLVDFLAKKYKLT